MYVFTLCRDYISVTSNGPCTFPGGRGMYPIIVYFGAILKTPPSSLWEKKHFRHTNLLSVYASTL